MRNLDFVDVVLAVGFLGSLTAITFAGKLSITPETLAILKDIAVGTMGALIGKKMPQLIGKQQ